MSLGAQDWCKKRLRTHDVFMSRAKMMSGVNSSFLSVYMLSEGKIQCLCLYGRVVVVALRMRVRVVRDGYKATGLQLFLVVDLWAVRSESALPSLLPEARIVVANPKGAFGKRASAASSTVCVCAGSAFTHTRTDRTLVGIASGWWWCEGATERYTRSHWDLLCLDMWPGFKLSPVRYTTTKYHGRLDKAWRAVGYMDLAVRYLIIHCQWIIMFQAI